MTTIAIVASGTRGDVQPYLALGKGLRAAGYEVRLLTSDNFEPLVAEAGLTFCSSGPSVEARLQSEAWRNTLASNNFLKVLAQMQKEMKREAAGLAHQMYDFAAGSDLVLAGMNGLTGAFSIAERLRIPVLPSYVFPFTPTRVFPSPLVPTLPFGRCFNRLSFDITRQLFWQSFKVSDIATRQAVGLPAPARWGPYRALDARNVPAMYGYSPHVLARPADWPANHQVTGYWFLDAPSDWTPPEDLVRFLRAGAPPLYIGFGSMGSRDPQAMAALVLEALARTGQRAILATGWGGLHATSVPNSVHLVSEVPHTWLFPQLAAVIHHGGAGTTAAGLRAGVPAIVVPFSADQPFWGKRVADLGVGPAPLPQKSLSASRLADAIRATVTNEAMQQRAATLGDRIRAEDGIGTAVKIVDQVLGRS